MKEGLVEKLNDSEDSPEEEPSDQIDEEEFSEEEVRRMRQGEVSIYELAEERDILKAAAEAELNRLIREQKVIDLTEYRKIRKELEDTRSPDKTGELLEQIKDLPKQKEQEEIEASKRLNPDHPRLLKVQRKAEEICNKNVRFIGTGQLQAFKSFFQQERRKNPTIGHLTELLRKLEGEIPDKDGLAPRREEFSHLTKLFQRYGLNPLESQYIKKEGLSERQAFRKAAEELEQHFEQQQDTGFYSREMIRKEMSELLHRGTPVKISETLTEAKNVSRQESEAFTHLDNNIGINGRQIRKMSRASKAKFLEYYQQINLKERRKLVGNIRTLVENEAKLAKELEKIYEDAPEELNLALESFEELDYLAKEKALREHKNLVTESKDKATMERTLTIKAAHAKIDAAAREKTIAAGADSTQGRYKDFFSDPDNFKNSETQEPDDLDELKKAYKTLISPTPQESLKNLAAYKQRREKFQQNLKQLDESTTQEWQDRYDQSGWSDREKIATEELPEEILHQKEEAKKDNQAGIENREGHETFTSRNQLVLALNTYLAEDTAESVSEGLKQIRMYFINNPEAENDRVLLYLEEQLAHRKRELGGAKQTEQSHETKIESEMKKTLLADSDLKDDLEEQQIYTLNTTGVQQSENLHDHEEDSYKRAKKDSLERNKSDSLEEKLTEDAYRQMGEEYILNEEGTGEEITEIYFDDSELSREEFASLKELTRKEQSKLTAHEGFNHVKLVEKSGNALSAGEAENIQGGQLDELEDELSEKTLDRLHAKEGDEISNLNDRITARRKARQLIEQRRHEKITA